MLGVLLATDGFGNSQVGDPWQRTVSHEITDLVEKAGPARAGRQVARWVSRSASSDGSGDDTTVALILSSDPQVDRPRRRLTPGWFRRSPHPPRKPGNPSA